MSHPCASTETHPGVHRQLGRSAHPRLCVFSFFYFFISSLSLSPLAVLLFLTPVVSASSNVIVCLFHVCLSGLRELNPCVTFHIPNVLPVCCSLSLSLSSLDRLFFLLSRTTRFVVHILCQDVFVGIALGQIFQRVASAWMVGQSNIIMD